MTIVLQDASLYVKKPWQFEYLEMWFHAYYPCFKFDNQHYIRSATSKRRYPVSEAEMSGNHE